MLVRVASGLLAMLVAACLPASPATSFSTVPVAASPSEAGAGGPSSTPIVKATAPASTATPNASAPVAGSGPPPAQLGAEGGEPVTGQLGTFVWHDEGSDSPWLPGAPITVGHGEPLSVTFASPVGVASWSARTVDARADGPAGATALGDGSGTPAFDAPAAGAWTLEVHVVFADDAGDASYFWRLDVR
jgi:hypothetical protein